MPALHIRLPLLIPTRRFIPLMLPRKRILSQPDRRQQDHSQRSHHQIREEDPDVHPSLGPLDVDRGEVFVGDGVFTVVALGGGGGVFDVACAAVGEEVLHNVLGYRISLLTRGT